MAKIGRNKNGISSYLNLRDKFLTPLLASSSSYLRDYERYFSKSICFEQDDVIVDIGAHIGLFSIPLILAHPCVRVFAFEPDVYNYNCLCENLRSNNGDQSRFKAEPCALYDRPGEVSFSPGGHSTVGSVVDAGFFLAQAESRLYMVKSTTLEAVFKENRIDRCKLLKMDCEGSEYAIFENLSDEILDRIDIIFAELHPVRNRNPVMLRDYLASKGFDVRGHRLNNGCWELFCERLG